MRVLFGCVSAALAVAACGLIAEVEPPASDPAEAGEASAPPAIVEAGAARDASQPEPADSANACIPQVSSAVVAHACSHTRNGPYESVVASAEPAIGASVDRIHVPYKVVLEPADAGGTYQGYLRFTPSRDQRHVLFTDQAAELLLTDASGSAVQALWTGPVTGCDSILDGAAFALTKGEPYTLQIRAEERTVLWFAEHLEAFSEPWDPACSL